MLDLDYFNWTSVPSITELLMLGANTKILDSKLNLLHSLPLCLRNSCTAPDTYVLTNEKYGVIKYCKHIELATISLRIYLNVNINTANILCIRSE